MWSLSFIKFYVKLYIEIYEACYRHTISNASCISDARNLQVLPHHEAKKQSIPISGKDIAEVDPEVTVIVDPTNQKRHNEDDQVATSRHEDHVVTDHEVDLGTGI